MREPIREPGSALRIERCCAVVAVALSSGRRTGARLSVGERRAFGLNAHRTVVSVPYPALAADWTQQTLTCGVALQCAPSKDLVAALPRRELSQRELRALSLIEAQVALGWATARWPGLSQEFRRLLPDLAPLDAELDAAALIRRAVDLARSRRDLAVPVLLGQLPSAAAGGGGLAASARRAYARMPWTSRRRDAYRLYSVPVGGDGGLQNPNIPPPSRPEDEADEVRPKQRAGLPYPEWNAWTGRFLPDQVTVLERRHGPRAQRPAAAAPELRRWFAARTHRVLANRRDDGIDLDIDAYVAHYTDTTCGQAAEARIFRDLLPGVRDVTTALLLDGSSSLGAAHGAVFRLELDCADALSAAMTAARERHGIFVFSGSTRHRVEVHCLKDFSDPRFVAPSGLGLVAGGYTRLGAPLRHLTSRLLAQPSGRRLLIVIGDGLASDEGYEGRYAWADVAHAVGEAEQAGVTVYYIGVGVVRVDPLPEMFGPRRSRRVRAVAELPPVLAQVHGELAAA